MKKRYILAVTVIFFSGVFIYANSLRSPFVYDDIHSIVENPHIRSFKNLGLAFTNPKITSLYFQQIMYRPLVTMSLILNYRLGGFDVFTYRILNLALHILNSILIFFIVGLLFKNIARQFGFRIAIFSALIFIAHPINSEAVNYIICRSELLGATFFLLSFVCFLKYIAPDTSLKDSSSYYRSSLISYMFGLLSKEFVITLPFILLVFDFIFLPFQSLNRWSKRFFKNYLGFFIISLFYMILRLTIIRNLIPTAHIRPLWINLLTQIKVLGYYLRLLFVPTGLTIEHSVSESYNIFEFPVIVSFSLIVLIILFTLRIRKRFGIIAFFIFWFFIILLPTSSIIPLYILMNEHRLYLPSAGFAVVLTTAIHNFSKNYSLSKGFPTFRIIIFSILLILNILTIKRNIVWQDETSLWSESIRLNPTSSRSYNNLGVALTTRSKFNEAEEAFKKAILLNPNYGNAYGGLGFVYENRNRIDEAIEYYKKAIEIEPYLIEARFLLGQIYEKKGRIEEALKIFKEGLIINPFYANFYFHLGLIYQTKGEYEEAKRYFIKTLELDPRNYRAHYNLGILYGELGDGRAIEEFRKTIALKSDFAEAHYNLAVSYAATLNPDFNLIHKHLNIAEKLGYNIDNRFLSYLDRLEKGRYEE